MKNMSEHCDMDHGGAGCGALDTLSRRVVEMERLNGENHRQMRDSIHDLELKFAKQEGQLMIIVGTLNDVKADSKQILEKLNSFSAQVDDVQDLEDDFKKLQGDVETIKSKPGQTWEDIKKQSIGWILGLILAIVAVALGLEKFL